MLENDLGALFVKETLEGSDMSEEALRKLFSIEQFDFESLQGVDSIDTKLQEAVERFSEGGYLGQWYGKGRCLADIRLVNPSRKERMEKTWKTKATSFYERTISVPVDFLIMFNGSDLASMITSCRIAEFTLPPGDADDEELKQAYAFFGPKLGEATVREEFNDKAEHIGIDQSLQDKLYRTIINEIFITIQSDASVLSKIKEAYHKAESQFPQKTIERIYLPEVLEQKRSIRDAEGQAEILEKRHGLFMIPGGKDEAVN